jgi:hypothetical protein
VNQTRLGFSIDKGVEVSIKIDTTIRQLNWFANVKAFSSHLANSQKPIIVNLYVQEEFRRVKLVHANMQITAKVINRLKLLERQSVEIKHNQTDKERRVVIDKVVTLN